MVKVISLIRELAPDTIGWLLREIAMLLLDFFERQIPILASYRGLVTAMARLYKL
jgi:hypothetical protein